MAILEQTNEPITMKLGDYLEPNSILFLQGGERDTILQTMVDRLAEEEVITDPAAFLHAIITREGVVSTGIGMGVALPHAKMALFTNFFISIAILKEGVEWHSLDDASVRLVFMIGGPDDKQTEYLQILSALTQFIREEANRNLLLETETPNQIIQLLEGCELT